MILCFPLDNTEYEANAMGAWCGTRTRGVFAADGHFAVTANGDMSVTVGAGLAWLKAAEYWGVNFYMDESQPLTVDAADGTFPRIDAVCLRLNKGTNMGEIIIKKGAYSPQPPAITPPARNLDYDEIYVATIMVQAGATSVGQINITDQRLNETYCGLMRDGVTGIPTQDLYNQWQGWMDEFRIESQAEFLDWFATVQDILDENTAGNLLNLINGKTDKVTSAVAGNFAGLDANGDLTDSGKSALDFIPNKNLLKNGYFCNPINTTGLSAYITDGSTIDNWTSYLVNVVPLTNGLYLATRTGTDARLWQTITGLDITQTYTLSVLINSTVYTVTGTPAAVATKVIIPGQAYLTITTSGDNAAVMLGVSQGATLTAVKAMKLELGSVSTLVSTDVNGDIGEPQIPAENYANKANRKIPATAGNIATLITNGDLGDSGVKTSDVYRRISLPAGVNIKDYLLSLGYSGCGQAVPTNTGTPVASQYWAFVIHWAASGRVVLEMFQAGSVQNRYYCTNTDGTWSAWYKITATAV